MFDTVFARDVQQTLDHFRHSVDQLFNSLYSSDVRRSGPSPTSETSNQVVFSPVIESGWNDNALYVRAIVPGVSDKDLRVSMQANQLLIEGERKAPENWTKAAYTQLPYGRFYAALTLPQGLDFDKLNCRLHEGVLDITIPVGEQLKPKQIHVQTEQRAISS